MVDVYRSKYGVVTTAILSCMSGLSSLLYCAAVLTTLGELLQWACYGAAILESNRPAGQQSSHASL